MRQRQGEGADLSLRTFLQQEHLEARHELVFAVKITMEVLYQ